ncbi:MAG: hypothetical protein FD123_400 [Bacteroidetes bacterium]|nr:MAG: hypothetical protein FD123_400 [Bacteroidota bacterium]
MKGKSSKQFRKALGQRIRVLRKSQKISQAQLAYEVGVTRETIVYIERGVQNATTDAIYNIAVALGISMKELHDFEW